MVSGRTCNYEIMFQAFRASILSRQHIAFHFLLSLPFASEPRHQAHQPRFRLKSKVLYRPRAPKAKAHLEQSPLLWKGEKFRA